MGREIRVTKIKIKKKKLCLQMETQGQISIGKICLVFRNIAGDGSYPFEFFVKEKKGKSEIHAILDVSSLVFQEGDWDVTLFLKNGEKENAILTDALRILLLLKNYQVILGTHILFPMGSTNHMLTFRYRQRSVYDGFDTRVKEFLAFGLYTILKPFWKKKRLWLVYEKYCTAAQDNGYYFFCYCMENLKDSEKKHIYYILDRNSCEWEKMKKYKGQVIPFMSFRHMLYILAADLYVAPDAKFHIYAWKAKPNLISREISKHKILFLQHGVTALKRVDHLFGKHGSSPMTYFTVTSEYEQKIVTENFGYPKEDVPILGFTRWDVLEDHSKENDRKILVMPTWRPWLEEQSDEVFCASDYYRSYRKLLEDQKLQRILEENHVKLIFHIHPKLQEFLKEFHTEGKNVELAAFGVRPLNELLMECSMLVTDYSSVSWDACYMGKPVLFYQFDLEMYLKANGSYLDMDRELFGDRCLTQEELLDKILEYIHRDFREKEEYGRMRKKYFTYQDKNNSKRTLEFILKKGY